jgi:hypothetical protein
MLYISYVGRWAYTWYSETVLLSKSTCFEYLYRRLVSMGLCRVARKTAPQIHTLVRFHW